MNIMVISDTHGNIDRAVDMYQRYDPFSRFELIIHCGDHQRDAFEMQKKTSCPVVSVRGNCDGCYGREYEVVETPAGRVLVTHGHAEGVKQDLMRLWLLASEENCVCVCFGHTHIAGKENVNGILMVNPGSLTSPRGGTGPSCAILAAKESGIQAAIMKY